MNQAKKILSVLVLCGCLVLTAAILTASPMTTPAYAEGTAAPDPEGCNASEIQNCEVTCHTFPLPVDLGACAVGGVDCTKAGPGGVACECVLFCSYSTRLPNSGGRKHMTVIIPGSGPGEET